MGIKGLNVSCYPPTRDLRGLYRDMHVQKKNKKKRGMNEEKK